MPRACGWPPGSRTRPTRPGSRSRCWPRGSASARPWSRRRPWPPSSSPWWTGHQVLNIEAALEAEGTLARPERVPAMCFLDLAGYTRLTEERGDQAAAELAGNVAVLVERTALAHGGTPV